MLEEVLKMGVISDEKLLTLLAKKTNKYTQDSKNILNFFISRSKNNIVCWNTFVYNFD